MTLRELYVTSQPITLDSIFVWPTEAHSMASSLDRYVENRLPATSLKEAQTKLSQIYVLGIYPTHFEEIAKELGFDIGRHIAFDPKPYRKRFNFIRPHFYLSRSKDILYVCVPPGLSYLKQYASLLRYFFSKLQGKVEFRVQYYPVAAERIAVWTSLADERFAEDTTCIVGHVDEFEQNIPKIKEAIKVISDNPYFVRSAFQIGTKTIEMIGFKFSFWGDISGHLAKQLYTNGCREIIYFGKVGALERHIELYRTLVVPRSFMLAEHDRITHEPFSVVNGLADFVDSCTMHVSTPTVMEQGYIQRQALDTFKPQTIDNEIAYMALTAKEFNDSHSSQRPVSFSSISFATDYVRRAHEHQLPSIFDLSNNRSTEALRMRQESIISVSRILYEYFST